MADDRAFPHYFKDVSNLAVIDGYCVLSLFNVTDPCLQHAIKKLLAAGRRGAKDASKDRRTKPMAIETATKLYVTLIDPEVSDERCIARIEADRAAVARAAKLELLDEIQEHVAAAYPHSGDWVRRYDALIAALRAKYGAAKDGG